MKLTLTLLAFLVSYCCLAQNELPLRKETVLKLPVDGERFYEQTLLNTPYFVNKNILQIYATEKVLVEVELRNDSILSMKTVKENLNPAFTIGIEFTQKTKGKKSELMMLKVTNPFERNLEYKARMFVVGSDKWIQTSIIPVKPKLIGYETWTDVIITLALYDWKLTD